MEIFNPLGKRDIFGIMLPGVIIIFTSIYALFGLISLLQLSVDLEGLQILLTVILFVVAYFAGSMLRLFAANDVDKLSHKYHLEKWREKYQAEVEHDSFSNFEKKRAELARGNDVSDIPVGFDEWLWLADDFPYSAWLNRIWRSRGFYDIFEFFQKNYGTSMWSGNRWASQNFLNYCKLAIIGGDAALADEVNMAEGLTRFFAGTVAAIRLSTWLLVVALITQVGLVVVRTFIPGSGTILPPVDWRFHIFYFVFTPALIYTLRRMRVLTVDRFRRIRQKETLTVFYAFYLYSIRHPDEMAKRDQTVLQKILGERLKSLFR